MQAQLDAQRQEQDAARQAAESERDRLARLGELPISSANTLRKREGESRSSSAEHLQKRLDRLVLSASVSPKNRDMLRNSSGPA